MSGKKKHKRLDERGIELQSRKGNKIGVRRIAPPEFIPEPIEVIIPEHEVEDTDDDQEDELYEYEREEEEEFEEEDEIEEDDFENYIKEINEQHEEEERTIEVPTITEFVAGGGDVKQIRKVRYITQQEAQDALESRGIDEFAKVLFDEETETFAIAVGDSPGAKVRK